MNGKAAPAVLALCAVALAGTVTACGGKKDDDAVKPSATKAVAHAAPTTTPPATPAANATLDAQQLKDLIVGHGDISAFTITPVEPGDFGRGVALGRHADHAHIEVTPAACQPVQDLTGFTGAYEPHAFVEQNLDYSFVLTKQFSLTEALLSYEGDDAHKTMADLTAALRTCKSFTSKAGASYGGVAAGRAPDLGDEAVTFHLTETVKDHGHPLHFPVVFTAVRVGRTIAEFYTPTPGSKDAEPVHDVIKPQVEKLMLPAG